MHCDDLAPALVAVVVILIWAFNVHADRTDRQELRVAIVQACASYEGSIKTCVERVKDGLDV